MYTIGEPCTHLFAFILFIIYGSNNTINIFCVEPHKPIMINSFRSCSVNNSPKHHKEGCCQLRHYTFKSRSC